MLRQLEGKIVMYEIGKEVPYKKRRATSAKGLVKHIYEALTY
jgi:hypothetical protein